MDFQTICILIIIAIGAGAAIYNFIKLGRERQIENIKEWLVFACLEAEKLLGSKTGQVKLSSFGSLLGLIILNNILKSEAFSIG